MRKILKSDLTNKKTNELVIFREIGEKEKDL